MLPLAKNGGVACPCCDLLVAMFCPVGQCKLATKTQFCNATTKQCRFCVAVFTSAEISFRIGMDWFDWALLGQSWFVA